MQAQAASEGPGTQHTGAIRGRAVDSRGHFIRGMTPCGHFIRGMTHCGHFIRGMTPCGHFIPGITLVNSKSSFM